MNMKPLFEVLGLKKTMGLLGLEIETEGENLPIFDSVYWKIEADGSLRNGGKEYVLKKPMELSSVVKAIAELNKKADEAGTKFNFSFRTSTHVHLNVQHNTYLELLNIIYTYYLLEAPLINYCGESRKRNRFCLAVEDAEGCVTYIEKLFKGDETEIAQIPPDKIRYSALNLEAIMKYGSIEFRSMRGTVDQKEIKTWIEFILAIREYGMSAKSPLDIYDSFLKLGAEEFAKKVFKDLYKELEYEDVAQDINRNFSLTIDFPFSYKASLEKKVEEPPKKKVNKVEWKIKGNDPFHQGVAWAMANPAAEIPMPQQPRGRHPRPAPVAIMDVIDNQDDEE